MKLDDNLLPLKVLLLEDSKAFALLVQRWLADAGCTVDYAVDLPQAEVHLRQASYDLLVADIELPSGESFALVERARALQSSMAVMVMTSQQRADYAVAALRLKVDDYLFKPFAPDELLAKVAQLARQRLASRRSVLAVGAHPDDVELGCGASLALHAQRGDRIHILTLSHGAAGGARDTRASEAQAAAAFLGAQLTLGDLTDTQITDGAPTIELIEACVRQAQPDIVYTHSERDAHQDHRNAFRATLVAARGVPTLLCYQSPSATVQFMPTRFVDIGAYLPQKLHLIEIYSSQASQRPYMQPPMIEANARYWGRFGAYALCEPFEVIRDR